MVHSLNNRFVHHLLFPKDRKQLLVQWVTSGQNASAIEADLVLSKAQSKKHQGTRELLTTQEMLKRDIPVEKVRAIVAKGNGVPDADCPNIPSLTRFWISTSTKEVETDETRQEAVVKMRADAQAGIEAVLGGGHGAPQSSAIGADNLQSILQNLNGNGGPKMVFTICVWYMYFVKSLTIQHSTNALRMSGPPAQTTPRPKANTRAKAKAKAKAAAAQVSEATPKTADDIKAEVSPDLKISMQQILEYKSYVLS